MWPDQSASQPLFSILILKLFLSIPQDYHVFFMHNPMPTRCLIFDLDTTLPFPTYFHKYVTETFRSDLALRPEHHRYVNSLLIYFHGFHLSVARLPIRCIRFSCPLFAYRFFRVVPAEQYLAEFSSDRRHMRRPDDTWIKPPPPYNQIQTSGIFDICYRRPIK